jgi:hypothetical protein
MTGRKRKKRKRLSLTPPLSPRRGTNFEEMMALTTHRHLDDEGIGRFWRNDLVVLLLVVRYGSTMGWAESSIERDIPAESKME